MKRFLFFVICLLIILGFACARREALGSLTLTDDFICEHVGDITGRQIQEVSGMIESKRQAGIFWMINDSGDKPALYAVSPQGELVSSVIVNGAENVDWEDLASFEYEGIAYLLIADAGNNTVERSAFVLYVVEEPMPGVASVDTAWTISFAFEDGAPDCEAVAVDAKAQTILLVSKRDVPATLYELPLKPADASIQTAVRLGQVTTVAQPKPEEIHDSLDRHHAQLTGLDIAPDGSTAALLTYRRLYLYRRAEGAPWSSVFQSKPRVFEFPKLKQAESICFSRDGCTLFITSEKTPAPIYKISLRDSL